MGRPLPTCIGKQLAFWRRSKVDISKKKIFFYMCKRQMECLSDDAIVSICAHLGNYADVSKLCQMCKAYWRAIRESDIKTISAMKTDLSLDDICDKRMCIHNVCGAFPYIVRPGVSYFENFTFTLGNVATPLLLCTTFGASSTSTSLLVELPKAIEDQLNRLTSSIRAALDDVHISYCPFFQCGSCRSMIWIEAPNATFRLDSEVQSSMCQFVHDESMHNLHLVACVKLVIMKREIVFIAQQVTYWEDDTNGVPCVEFDRVLC
jgi:Zn-finger protein